MKFGSLFSGIGGFDLGLERAGHSPAWMVEKEVRCRMVLRHHWPGVTIYEDVRDVGRSNLAPVDLLCGGFPCQDVSVAGRRAGLGGERSGLWFEFLRIVAELTPRWVLVENVPGLRSSNRGRDLAVIVQGLAELGYVGAWRSLDSQYLGVAQRRERIFLLACRDSGAGSPSEVLALAEGLSGHPAPRRQARKGVAGRAQGSAGGEGGGVAFALRGRDGGATAEPGDDCAFALRSSGGGGDKPHVLAGTLSSSGAGTARTGNERSEPEMVVVGTLEARNRGGGFPGTDGAASGHVVAFGWANSPSQGMEVRDVPDAIGSSRNGTPAVYQCHGSNVGPMGALRVGNGNVPFFARLAPRRLTPRECERLQDFPDDWTRYGTTAKGATVEIKDSPRYAMLGNAITVSVSHWIASRIPESSSYGEGGK